MIFAYKIYDDVIYIPLRGRMSEKINYQNQDKQTPHTVLQKLSPKTTHVPLMLFSLFLINSLLVEI